MCTCVWIGSRGSEAIAGRRSLAVLPYSRKEHAAFRAVAALLLQTGDNEGFVRCRNRPVCPRFKGEITLGKGYRGGESGSRDSITRPKGDRHSISGLRWRDTFARCGQEWRCQRYQAPAEVPK